MRIISKSTLREFWRRRPDAKDPLLAWYRRVKRAAWTNSAELKKAICKRECYKQKRVVFNIKGNRYRLVVEIDYTHLLVYVCFVGTHAEYDSVDAETVRHGRSKTRSKRARLRNRPGPDRRPHGRRIRQPRGAGARYTGRLRRPVRSRPRADDARYRSAAGGIGIEPEELAERYPRLFHMAAAGSWSSIARHGLLGASALLDLFRISGERREEIESRHRPESVPICGGRAVVRDQKPMNEAGLRKCLRDGLTPREWYRMLNSKVFFWETRERLEKMLRARAYKNMWHTVLVVDTESLLADCRDRVTLSPINSGSTLFRPPPRGRDTFLPPGEYPFRRRRRERGASDAIAELAVDRSVPDIRKHVLLVEERKAGAPPKLVWRRESAGAAPCAGRS